MKNLSQVVLIMMIIIVTSLHSWADPTKEEQAKQIGPMTIYADATPVNQADYCGKDSYVYAETTRLVLTSLVNPSAKNIFEYTLCGYYALFIGRHENFFDKLYIYQSSPTKMVLVIAPEGTWSQFLYAKFDPVVEKRYQNWTYHEFDLMTGALIEKPMSQWPKGLIKPGLPAPTDCDSTLVRCTPGFRQVNFPKEIFRASDGVALLLSMKPETVSADKEPKNLEITVKTSDGFETVLIDPILTRNFFRNESYGRLYMGSFRATEHFVAFNFRVYKTTLEGDHHLFVHPLHVINRTTSKVQILSAHDGGFELYSYPNSTMPLNFYEVNKDTYGYNAVDDSRSYLVNTESVQPIVHYDKPKVIRHVSQDGRYVLLAVGETEIQLRDLKNNQQVFSTLNAGEGARLYSVDVNSAVEINPKGEWKFWKLQGAQFVETTSGKMNELIKDSGYDPFHYISVYKFGSEVCIYELAKQHQCFKY